MGTYTIPKNTSIDIGLDQDYIDNGWAIYSGVATHDPCNSGTITNDNFKPQGGVEYKITYTVSNYASGSVYAVLGGVNGQEISSNGTFTETIITDNNNALMFWSDGSLTISNVVISSGVVQGTTLAFDQNNLKFTTYYSFLPEFMAKFLDRMYSFKNGTLWEHNENEERNTFYGQHYPSVITFYINTNPTTVKNLSGIRLNSTKPWSITDIEIRPIEGKSKGQRSRIKKGNFKNLQGQWFADFLRDMNDPRFSNEIEALFKGAELQGMVAKITMEINEKTEVRLVSVDTLISPQQYTY